MTMSSEKDGDRKTGGLVDNATIKTEVGNEISLEQVMYGDFASRSPTWREEHERALVKKIDIRLMPLLTTIYLLNYLDRANLSQARQGTLEKDLGMKGSDFNLATSIFSWDTF